MLRIRTGQMEVDGRQKTIAISRLDGRPPPKGKPPQDI
jgi:hypothetical protein